MWLVGGIEPIPNAAEVRESIDQRIRQLQRQAVPVEPAEMSLRRQLRAQQPGRRLDNEREVVAGALSSGTSRACLVLPSHLDLVCLSFYWVHAASAWVIAAVLRSARATARAEVAARAPFSQVHMPHRQGRGVSKSRGAANEKNAISSNVSVPSISELITQRLASAREAAAAEFLRGVPS